jgi:hypothetical protein
VGWVSATALKAAIKDELSIDTFQVDANGLNRWDGICARAVEVARTDVKNALTPRGYSVAQVEGWDDLAAVHMAQSMYRALWADAATQPPEKVNRDAINSFDQREMLMTATLATDDAAAPPDRARKTASGVMTDGIFSLCDGDMGAWRRNRPRRRF